MLLGLLFLLQSAFAGVEQAPPSFSYREGQAVFVDFKKADYAITLDATPSKGQVRSEIEFEMPSDGYPLFDLTAPLQTLKVDGETVTQSVIQDPASSTSFRVINKLFSRGTHRMIVSSTFDRGVSFTPEGVAAAFWMSDLQDRQYLEQFLPTSFEYDSYAMVFQVEVLGMRGKPHRIFTNGTTTKISENRFEVVFPAWFTTSTLYFHLLPENAVPVRNLVYRSADGRNIPIEIYSKGDLGAFATKTVEVLRELEGDYGPFPHPSLVIYGSGLGGMEYAGATQTSLYALSHELFHSYHARAVMPANGNAGWMDEAIASWRDNRYPLTNGPRFAWSQMAGHSPWNRFTDTAAYSYGAYFLAWIAYRLDQRAQSFKGFLREYYEKNRFTTVTTEQFQAELQARSGLDLRGDFNQYIYGTDRPAGMPECGMADCSEFLRGSSYHPRLTRDQLDRLLWP